MSKSLCRWGVMSAAVIAQKNWQAIVNSGNGRVVAVASRTLDKAQDFIDRCHADCPQEETARAVEGYQQLIDADDIDAVYIPLPTGLRKQWVIAAAKAGKHVMCEKPCAINADDLEEMVEACRTARVQFMDGVMYMHSARLDSLRKAIKDPNAVGDVKRITTQFSFNAPEDFREGNIRTNSSLEPQGCLGDLGWYTIRFALWLMKYEMPVRVRGRILTELKRSESPAAIPMEFSGELEFAGGVSCSFYNSFVTEHQQWANVSGTKGMLHIFDYVLPYSGDQLGFTVSNSEFVVQGCDFEMKNHSRQITTAEHANSAVDSQEANLFRTFADIVSSGTPDEHWPRISVMTQRVMDACLESGRNDGKTIEF